MLWQDLLVWKVGVVLFCLCYSSLCDVYLTINFDYPWFLYKRVMLVAHHMDEHSELLCFSTNAIRSAFDLRVWFKHHVLHSSQWRKSIVRILKPTDVLILGGHNGSCLMFCLEGGPIFKLSAISCVSLIYCHVLKAYHTEDEESGLHPECWRVWIWVSFNGAASVNVNVGTKNEHGDSFYGTTVYS